MPDFDKIAEGRWQTAIPLVKMPMKRSDVDDNSIESLLKDAIKHQVLRAHSLFGKLYDEYHKELKTTLINADQYKHKKKIW